MLPQLQPRDDVRSRPLSPAPGPHGGTSDPDPDDAWWLGRGVALALALMIGVVVWASTHEVTATTAAPSLAQRGAAAEVVLSPVAVADPAALDQQRPAERLSPTGPARPDAEPTAAERAQEKAREQEQAALASRAAARRAAAAQRQEQARIARAIRADQQLASFIASVETADSADLWVTPLRAAYRITATFGQAGRLWSRDHTGLDLAAPTGTPVAAVAAGTVRLAGSAGAYGSKIEIEHADGTATWYAHLSHVGVAVGDVVEAGATIGAVGATGNVTGPHLHLEVRPAGSGPVDPVRALAARGVAL